MLGILTGALDNSAWSLLTPYLRTAGFSDHLSLFALTVFVWGQVVLLVPLGYLADKLGEGILLRWLSVFIVLYSLVLTQADGLSTKLILVLTFLFGPACFSIYGAALALAGKTVGRVQLPVASASLVTGWCLGGFFGAVTVGSGMDFLDAKAFPVALLLFATGVTLVVTRMIPRRRPCVDAGAATGPTTNALRDPPPRRVA
jgi:MFS family permease